jgi:hypothetical protein
MTDKENGKIIIKKLSIANYFTKETNQLDGNQENIHHF